jgi:hypothetical protein
MWLIRSPNNWARLLCNGKTIFLKLSLLLGKYRGSTGKLVPPMPYFHPIRCLFRLDFILRASNGCRCSCTKEKASSGVSRSVRALVGRMWHTHVLGNFLYI